MPTTTDMRRMTFGQAFGRAVLPDVTLSGKTAIVTGANTGLGLETAKHLIQLKISNLILACRSVERASLAKDTIIKETRCQGMCTIQVWPFDLADYHSVLSFGSRVQSDISRLDIFIANAGVELTKFDTAEGLERTLTVNVVSTMLSALTVLPKLRETAAKFRIRTNLTFVGSTYHIFASPEDLEIPEEVDIFEALSKLETANMQTRYALSKLMLHQCQAEFAALVSSNDEQDTNTVVVNIVNPGWCKTELVRNKPPAALTERIMFSLIGWTAEKGSRVVAYAATLGAESHGGYVSECALKLQSDYMRSEHGLIAQKRIWKDLMARLEQVRPGVAPLLR